MGVFQNNLMGAAAAAASAGGAGFYTHQIANSVRNSSAQNGTLKRTAGTPTSSTTFTLSYWVKRYHISAPFEGSDYNIFVAGTAGLSYVILGFRSGADLTFEGSGGNYTNGSLISSALYRDTSAWYHHVLTFDSTDSTQADRIKRYVNGERGSLATDTITGGIGASEDFSFINESGVVQAFGGLSGKGHGTEGAEVQMAEIVFNDGQAYGPDSYGETKNGVWIPKDPSGLTFGDNGYYLKFESSSDLGNDSSGNNNDFTAANLAAHDQMLDSPTFNSDSNTNFPTINPLDPTIPLAAISNGNLQITEVANNRGAKANFAIPLTGKWYWEHYVYADSAQELWGGITGIDTDSSGEGRGGSSNSTTYGASWSNYSGSNMYIRKYIAGVESAESGSFGPTKDTILGVAINRDDNEAKFYKNNALQFTTAISATQEYFPAGGMGGGTNATTINIFNFGQDGTFAGNETAQGNSDGNGYGNFYYAPPTDFLALCSGNLPTADAVDPAQTDDDYPQKLFNTKLYTGTGSSNALTGVGFQPDLTWIKETGGINDHKLTDSTRGVTIATEPNTSDAQSTDSNGLTAFGTDGFTVGSDVVYNNSSDTYVAWNWRLNGGTTAANAVGGTSSVTQVDPSGGVSVVTYTGFSGSNGSSTVGHGMSVAPELIIHNASTGGGKWTQNKSTTNANYFLELNGTRAQTELAAGTYGAMSRPTTSVFSINGVDGVGGSSRNYVAFCFASIEGYCKVGSYEGNGNVDGPFVYTGFRPNFVIIKNYDRASDWRSFNIANDPYNYAIHYLAPNTSAAMNTTDNPSGLPNLDILSNGFKIRSPSTTTLNYSGDGYIYIAMAKNPFQYATAR